MAQLVRQKSESLNLFIVVVYGGIRLRINLNKTIKITNSIHYDVMST